MLGVSEVKLAVHVTGLMPSGKLAGTTNGTPARNMLPPSFEGTVVTHMPPVNVVVAVVADGEFDSCCHA